jgi:hypothetical protein
VIIGGGSRRGAKWFATHLMRNDEGQLVRLAESRGLAGYDISGWFRQMEAVSFGSRAENYFYHANINPRDDEPLTEAQWGEAIDRLEHNLGLDGHSRFVVEHEKNGRTHRHVFWSRIDPDTMTAVSDSKTYRIHERTADELEKAFGHEPTPRGRGPEGRNPHNWEVFRGQKTGINPYDVGAELTLLWRQADSGPAFAAALEPHDYILAKGRRGLCVVDPAGKEHSLARRIEGARKKDIDARMEGIDREALPSVEVARAMARERAAGRRKDAPDAPLADLAPNPGPDRSGPAGARFMLPAPERTPFEQAVARYTEPVSTPRELRAFERNVEQWQLAYGEAAGDGSFIAEGIDWLTRKLGLASGPSSPPVREGTAFERVVNETRLALRDNGGEPYNPDGTSFWQRAAATLREITDRAASWVKDRVGDFVGRLTRERQPDREHEPDFER